MRYRIGHCNALLFTNCSAGNVFPHNKYEHSSDYNKENKDNAVADYQCRHTFL